MSITSGLAPIRNYANGGDVNTERQNMLAKLGFPSGITNEQLDAAIAKEKNAAYLPESQEPGTTVGQLPGLFKENVFDPTDPVDILTLPFVSLKAAKGIGKFGENIYNKVRGSGGKIRENLRGISAYVGADMLADEIRDDSDPFFTKQEDGTYESTRPLTDAQDEANEDLKKANEKEEKEREKKEKEKEDEKLTPKQKGIKAAFAALESLADSGSQSASTPGFMIEGSGISTPEIRRYEAGGIASLEPAMMANGGIANYSNEIPGYFLGGLAKIGKGVLKGGKDYYKKITKKEAKQKGADVDKKKPETKKKEETGVTKDEKTKTAKVKEEVVRAVPPELGLLAAPIIGAGKLTKEAIRRLGGEGGLGRGAARAGIYGGLGLAGYNALTGDEKKTLPPTKSTDATVPEIEEATSMRDIHYSRSLERAQAAGRTEPTFMDYLASFPKSYTDKLSKDPEFAQQMIAGFTAMMQPSEGFVTRNAFGDFAQGVQDERVRQEGEVPDQIKMFKEFERNPQLLEAYKKFTKSTEPVDLLKDQQNMSLLFNQLQESVFGKDYDDEDDIPVDIRTKTTTTPNSVYSEWLSLGGDSQAFETLKGNFSDV